MVPRKVHSSEESIVEGFDLVSEDRKCFWGQDILLTSEECLRFNQKSWERPAGKICRGKYRGAVMETDPSWS